MSQPVLMDDKPCHPRSAWTAMKDGFNANEIAYMWGVNLATALGMMRAAIPKPEKRERLRRRA